MIRRIIKHLIDARMKSVARMILSHYGDLLSEEDRKRLTAEYM